MEIATRFDLGNFESSVAMGVFKQVGKREPVTKQTIDA